MRKVDRQSLYAAFKASRPKKTLASSGLKVRVKVEEAKESIPRIQQKPALSWGEAEEKIFNGQEWDKNQYHWDYYGKWFGQMGGDPLAEVFEKRASGVLQTKRVLKGVLEGAAAKESRIPHIMHRVWITRSENPYEVPPTRVDCYLNTIEEELPSNWKHFFWCVDKKVLPKTVQKLEGSGRVQVRELKEIWDQMRGRDVFSRLFDAKIFALCCDVVRCNLVYLFGGIYADFGVQFLRDISPLMNRFDYFGSQEGCLYLNTIIGAVPKHHGLDKTLTLIDNLDRVPLGVREAFSEEKAPFWVGSAALTLGMDQTMKEGDLTLLLHDKTRENPISNPYYRINHMRSWAEDGGFGQNTIYGKGFKPNDLYFPKKPWYETKAVARWLALDEPGHDIIGAFSQGLFEQDRASIKEKRRGILERSREVFHDLSGDPKKVIPHTTHQIWLTENHEIPDVHIESTIGRVRTWGEGWQHIFWCVDPDKIPQSIARLKEKAPNIEVRKVADYFGEEDDKYHMYGQRIYKKFLGSRLFPNAKDILQKNVLFRYGGFFSDMAVTFKKSLTPLVDSYDMLFFFQPEIGLVDSGVMACRPQHDAFAQLLHTYDTLKTFPVELRKCHCDVQICVIGIHLLNSFLMKYLGEDEAFLPLENGISIGNTSTGSWRNGKYGNTSFFDFIKTTNIFEI